ncbi:MAG: methyltransferase domain-containing protein [Crocosphaera sp.]|nr:methyltransferase domain-containing protein [Crocosphaera sp.]
MKKYTTNAFLQVQDSQVYSIFAWSQKKAKMIVSKSWLLILEIFIEEHSLETAYHIFQQKKLEPIAQEVIEAKNKHQKLIENDENLLIFLSQDNFTLLGEGFRSFIEKKTQSELGSLSQKTHQILLHFWDDKKLEDDLHKVNSLEAFTTIFKTLETMGLLSPSKTSLNWGDLSRQAPICQAFGLTRGNPVDRYYLRQFIQEIQEQISGKILEVGGTAKDKDFYEINQGDSYQILNLEAGVGVDIVGDVHNPSIIEPESLDSVIIFNVLEHCYAPWIAVENIHKWLKKGGKCFAMVPNGIRVHATPVDYWRPLPDGMKFLFRNFAQQQLYVYGNPMTVIASYHGIAAEELSEEELNNFHPDYPVATCIVAEK